jgi:molecular chaperone DnaK (HSP70)
MGAGTTDIAAFERDTTVAPSKLTEIAAASQCCPLAGDELDNIVIDLFVRAGGKHGLAAEDRLWRAVKLSARSLKRDLFERGESAFQDLSKKRIRVTRGALEKDPSFRAFCKALTHAVAASLAPLHARAQQKGAGTITVLLAGGGSNLPFLSKVVRAAAARAKIKMKVKIERFGANWSLPHRRHPFDGVFPQLAIAMGGALAPVAQIAVREHATSGA